MYYLIKTRYMNAIILAAGMGTRLRPLTNEIPKCLVKVKGVPMVERQIQFLKEKGIVSITLISGYKADRLDYLKEKYGVDIIYNEQYDQYNNIYSLYLSLDKFSDTYVIEGDIWMEENCFQTELTASSYFSPWRDSYLNEWGLVVDKDMNLRSINIGDGQGYLMSGISYWKKDDCKIIADQLIRRIQEGAFKDLYWDNIILELMDQLEIKVVPVSGIYEIDTVEDLYNTENV